MSSTNYSFSKHTTLDKSKYRNAIIKMTLKHEWNSNQFMGVPGVSLQCLLLKGDSMLLSLRTSVLSCLGEVELVGFLALGPRQMLFIPTMLIVADISQSRQK